MSTKNKSWFHIYTNSIHLLPDDLFDILPKKSFVNRSAQDHKQKKPLFVISGKDYTPKQLAELEKIRAAYEDVIDNDNDILPIGLTVITSTGKDTYIYNPVFGAVLQLNTSPVQKMRRKKTEWSFSSVKAYETLWVNTSETSQVPHFTVNAELSETEIDFFYTFLIDYISNWSGEQVIPAAWNLSVTNVEVVYLNEEPRIVVFNLQNLETEQKLELGRHLGYCEEIDEEYVTKSIASCATLSGCIYRNTFIGFAILKIDDMKTVNMVDKKIKEQMMIELLCTDLYFEGVTLLRVGSTLLNRIESDFFVQESFLDKNAPLYDKIRLNSVCKAYAFYIKMGYAVVNSDDKAKIDAIISNTDLTKQQMSSLIIRTFTGRIILMSKDNNMFK